MTHRNVVVFYMIHFIDITKIKYASLENPGMKFKPWKSASDRISHIINQRMFRIMLLIVLGGMIRCLLKARRTSNVKGDPQVLVCATVHNN